MASTAPTTKRCPGFLPDGIQPHEAAATPEVFNRNKGSKDGLSTRCRDCGNRYSKAWSAAKKRGEEFSVKAPAAQAAEAPAPAPVAPPASLHVSDPKPTPQYANELAVQAGRGRAKGYTTTTIGGLVYALPESSEAVASAEGQHALATVNEAKAAARRAADAERKRNERAAARAAKP